MSLTCNSTAITSLNVNGSECKNLVLNNIPVWAKKYSLTTTSSQSSVTTPSGFIVRTVGTDLEAPVGGNPSNYCYHNEKLSTVLTQDSNNHIFYPSGDYTITGATNIKVNAMTVNPCWATIAWESDNATDHSFEISMINPLDEDHNENMGSLKYPPAIWAGESLEDHFKFYIQIVVAQTATGGLSAEPESWSHYLNTSTTANGTRTVNFAYGLGDNFWLPFNDATKCFEASLKDLSLAPHTQLIASVRTRYKTNDIAVRTCICYDYKGATATKVHVTSRDGSQGIALPYLLTLPAPWDASSSSEE